MVLVGVSVACEVVVVDSGGGCECRLLRLLDTASESCDCFLFLRADMFDDLVVCRACWSEVINLNGKFFCKVSLIGGELRFLEGVVEEECILVMDGRVVEVGDTVSHGFVPECKFVGWLGCRVVVGVVGEEGFEGGCSFNLNWIGCFWDGVTSGEGEEFWDTDEAWFVVWVDDLNVDPIWTWLVGFKFGVSWGWSVFGHGVVGGGSELKLVLHHLGGGDRDDMPPDVTHPDGDWAEEIHVVAEASSKDGFLGWSDHGWEWAAEDGQGYVRWVLGFMGGGFDHKG